MDIQQTQLYVFVSTLPDLQTLLSAVPEGGETLVLDGNQDGVAQLAQALAGRQGLSALHIFSHGAAGSLQLGSSTLDAGSIPSYQDQLATIGHALTDTGDILLYGCNVAQGALGQAFIAQIALATGADVAASDDFTGATGLGGDWVLESNVGAVDTAAVTADAYQASVLTSPLNQQSSYDLNEALDAALLAQTYDFFTPSSTPVNSPREHKAILQSLQSLGWTPLTSTNPNVMLDIAGGYTASNGFDMPMSNFSGYAFAVTRVIGGVKEYAISFAGIDFGDSGDIQSDFQTYGFSNAYKALRPIYLEMLKQAIVDDVAHLV